MIVPKLPYWLSGMGLFNSIDQKRLVRVVSASSFRGRNQDLSSELSNQVPQGRPGGIIVAKLQLLVTLKNSSEPNWQICENPVWLVSDPKVFLITPPLPADQISLIWQKIKKLQGIFNRIWDLVPWPPLLLLLLQLKLRLKYPGFPMQLSKQNFQPWRLDCDQQDQLFTTLKGILRGRLLTGRLFESELRAQGWWPADIRRALDIGVNQDLFHFLPGIKEYPWGELRCSRCDSVISQFRPCVVCGRIDCPSCVACESLGMIRGCSQLWHLPEGATLEQISHDQPVVVNLDFELTDAQSRASKSLVDFYQSKETEILVWAACGAGKTEVTFAAIAEAISSGVEVLFAVPRRDVVVELAERIKLAFPTVEVAVHYGGQPWQQKGQLVVATTHQTLRFFRRFGLIVLDEVDAFPYHGSELLRFAIRRSLATDGKLIEMTATPHQAMRRKKILTIPARYHGYPLPEPELLKLKLPALAELSNTKFHQDVIKIIRSNLAPWLIFVPTITAVKEITKQLRCEFGNSVCGSWAADPMRDQKREALISGSYRIMVTTSIMERGVTITNVQVMVLYSDHQLFDSNALIQMAGRAGRKVSHPTGEVWLIGSRITEAMRLALKQIHYLNQEADRLGLLRGGVK